MEKCGQVNFWKLAIKPGKPLAFGKIGDCWYFGLPGNPVAVLVTYHKFVKPGLDCLLGDLPRPPLQLRVRSDSQLRKVPGRSEYQRGILKQGENGELTVATAGPQDSHQLKVASMANCFIVLDADCDGVSAATGCWWSRLRSSCNVYSANGGEPYLRRLRGANKLSAGRRQFA
ncbi:hypothetical protein [Methylomonas koyamae]|uniref:hypothetical protein n=1 Tax=Methylomonas koyamae TaxID=702114 RepID=UPI0035711953